jgi:hypothetical protein
MALPCPNCCGLKSKPCGPGGTLWGENLLLYTDGGGVENIGVSRAINEMLVTSIGGVGGVLTLFPFWPASLTAAFGGLAVKGGLLVGAAYDNATAAVGSPFTIIATVGATATQRVRLADPWGKGALTVTCGTGAPIAVSWESAGVCTFELPGGQTCGVGKV